jgi:hypothetical protein
MGLLSVSGWLDAVDWPEDTAIATHHSLGELPADSSFPALVFQLALRSVFISFGDDFSPLSPEPLRSAARLHLSTASLFKI